METKSNESMAVIFKRKSDDSKSLEFESIAKVVYDPDDMYYIITSGSFEGSDESDFNKLSCEPSSLFDSKGIVNFEEAKGLAEYNDDAYTPYSIYVFPRDYVDGINAEDFTMKCIKIASKLKYTSLDLTEDESVLKTRINRYSERKEVELNPHVLKNMLRSDYEVEDSIEIEPSFIKTGSVPEPTPMPTVPESTPISNFEEMPQTEMCDINVDKIIDEINHIIVGQEEAVSVLVTNIYYNQLLIDYLSKDFFLDEAELDSSKVAILIEGATGTGKTAIIKQISSRLKLPFIKSNINSFSETGYVGPTITDLLRKLYFASGKNIGKAERGIIFLDEVDKIASKSGLDGKDMKKGVQEELLGFISGGEYDVPLDENGHGKGIHFDTSKLTFILGGAWTDLRERKIKEAKKKNKDVGVGFGRNKEVPESDKTYTITAEDYIDEGLEREFFGRIKVLVCTKTYEVEDLRNILLTSVISPLKNIERTVRMFGYKGITYADEFIDEVCNQAYDMGTGARALQAIMLGIQSRLLRKLISKEFDLDEPIELTTSLLHQYNQSLVRRYK